MSKAGRTSETSGAFQIHSHKTRIAQPWTTLDPSITESRLPPILIRLYHVFLGFSVYLWTQ